jgi:hypothetical protein
MGFVGTVGRLGWVSWQLPESVGISEWPFQGGDYPFQIQLHGQTRAASLPIKNPKSTILK